jgi:hypothetical protein
MTMKFEEIVKLWGADSEYDKSELADESLKSPKLHHKYSVMFHSERTVLRSMEYDLDRMIFLKTRYYQGKLTEDEIKSNNLVPWEENKVLKGDMVVFLNADDDLIKKKTRVALQTEKVAFLESIIKSINSRNWEIRNAIEFMKFMNGE